MASFPSLDPLWMGSKLGPRVEVWMDPQNRGMGRGTRLTGLQSLCWREGLR